MIERGQVFVRALNSEGHWSSVDALDLDEESFKRFVLAGLTKVGIIFALMKEEGEATPYRERPST